MGAFLHLLESFRLRIVHLHVYTPSIRVVPRSVDSHRVNFALELNFEDFWAITEASPGKASIPTP
jgi:hypothetical protein